jgi:hypothetical protein
MIMCFKVVFSLALSISKTHMIVKLETFPHFRRAHAGSGWDQGAVRPPPNKYGTSEIYWALAGLRIQS